MKERPILFQTPMVQGIMALIKTQTRRTKGLEFINENPDVYHKFTHRDGELWSCQNITSSVWDLELKCPYGKIGDLLWVRESFDCENVLTSNGYIDRFTYKATSQSPFTKWKPSIHMPKEAARIWLQITDIKIERLKDISEADAKAEGIEPVDGGYKNYATLPKIITELKFWDSAKMSFLSLWESINGYESSNLNPWVWVITFEIC